MVPITASFRFTKAGQGCFYTSLFTENNTNKAFSVVYDCGTHTHNKSYIHNEIWRYKANLLLKNNNTLNLLIISHFDEDHVNELSTLLEDLGKCQRVILPYLTPEERLQLYIAHLARGEGTSHGYAEFLMDPIAFLTQFGNVDEIIFLTGDGGLANNFNPDNPDSSNTAFIRDGFLSDDREIKNNPADNNRYPEISNLRNKYPGVVIGVYKDKARFFIKDIWEFYFYNRTPTVPPEIRTLIQKLKKKFPILKKPNDFTRDKASFLAKKQKVTEIKKIYQEGFKNDKEKRTKTDLNPTSLLLYHSPVENNRKKVTLYAKKCFFSSQDYDLLLEKQPATLLTGDIYLEGLNIPHYIRDNFGNIRFLQIPHHGSETKWDLDVLNNTDRKKAVFAIVNFGLGNTHKHPKEKVIDDIKKETNWKIELVHQLRSFWYEITLYY